MPFMRTVQWLRATFVACAALGLLTIFVAAPVFAHAEPEITVPPMDGSVENAPPVLEITFSEEVADGTTIDVVGPDGKSVNAAPAQIDLNDPNRKHVTVELYGALPAGVYTVNWSSISAEDGDPDSGSYAFTVTQGAATPAASPSASPAASPAATPGGTPIALSRDDTNAAAEAAQQRATQQAATEDNFDGRAYLISVIVAAAAALLIYLFWRIVRPKPGERVY
jgi:methionine-rich copper-binding protein CopC